MGSAKKGAYTVSGDKNGRVTIVDPFGSNKELFVPASYTNQLRGLFKKNDYADFAKLAEFFTQYDCGLFLTNNALQWQMLHPRPTSDDVELIVAAKPKKLQEIADYFETEKSIKFEGKLLCKASQLETETNAHWRLSRVGAKGEEETVRRSYGVGYIVELSPNKQLRNYRR